MCGITGFLDFTCTSDLSILTRMTDTLVHRGPDDSGYEVFKTDEAMIGLGHRRLSILDLSAEGKQPMTSELDGMCYVLTVKYIIFRISGLSWKL